MDFLNNHRALTFGAGAAVATFLLATMVHGALSVREPPLEAADGAGLRIHLVEPPRAPLKAGGLLEVGLSGADREPVIAAQARMSRTPAPRAPAVSSNGAADRIERARIDDLDDEAYDRADLADRERAWQDRQAREAYRHGEPDDQERYARDGWGPSRRDERDPREPTLDVERRMPPPEDFRPHPDDQ